MSMDRHYNIPATGKALSLIIYKFPWYSTISIIATKIEAIASIRTPQSLQLSNFNKVRDIQSFTRNISNGSIQFKQFNNIHITAIEKPKCWKLTEIAGDSHQGCSSYTGYHLQQSVASHKMAIQSVSLNRFTKTSQINSLLIVRIAKKASFGKLSHLLDLALQLLQ